MTPVTSASLSQMDFPCADSMLLSVETRMTRRDPVSKHGSRRKRFAVLDGYELVSEKSLKDVCEICNREGYIGHGVVFLSPPGGPS